MNLSKLWETVKVRVAWLQVLQSMGSQRVRHNSATEQSQQSRDLFSNFFFKGYLKSTRKAGFVKQTTNKCPSSFLSWSEPG